MTMRQLAKSRDARVYLIGQSFSLFGDTAIFLALGIWVKELTHSNADAGLTFLFLPLAALFAPLAGMVVDRVRRRPTLVCVNFVSAALVMLLLFVIYPVVNTINTAFTNAGGGHLDLMTCEVVLRELGVLK